MREGQDIHTDDRGEQPPLPENGGPHSAPALAATILAPSLKRPPVVTEVGEYGSPTALPESGGQSLPTPPASAPWSRPQPAPSPTPPATAERGPSASERGNLSKPIGTLAKIVGITAGAISALFSVQAIGRGLGYNMGRDKINLVYFLEPEADREPRAKTTSPQPKAKKLEETMPIDLDTAIDQITRDSSPEKNAETNARKLHDALGKNNLLLKDDDPRFVSANRQHKNHTSPISYLRLVREDKNPEPSQKYAWEPYPRPGVYGKNDGPVVLAIRFDDPQKRLRENFSFTQMYGGGSLTDQEEKAAFREGIITVDMPEETPHLAYVVIDECEKRSGLRGQAPSGVAIKLNLSERSKPIIETVLPWCPKESTPDTTTSQ